ncbi:MAG: J domain-containing protein [Cellulophaga sp.]
MTITINNEIILGCLFFFGISWFFAHLFFKAGTFFKIVIFFISFSIFIPLEKLDNIYLTIASFLGIVTAHYGGLFTAFIRVKDFFCDAFYWFKDTFSSFFDLINSIFSKLKQAIIFIISLFPSYKKARNKNSYTSHNQEGVRNNKNNSRDYEEQSRRTKEEFKKAREESQRREELDGQDNRSFEDIVGVNPGYTNNDLKSAYKRASSKFHPDKYSHMSENFRAEAEQEFKKIQKAYRMLSNRLN